MNTVSLVGRLTRDPHLIESKNGKIAKFDLATKVGYDSENKKDRVEFVPITAFGLADAFLEHLKKGRMVSLFGRVGQDRFEKDGSTQYVTSVKVQGATVQLLDSKNRASAEEPAGEEPAERDPADDGSLSL